MEAIKTNQTKKQSPNLLNKDLFEKNPLIEKAHVDVSLTAKILIIIVQIIYILLLGFNEKIINDIETLESQVRVYETEIRDSSDLVSKTKKVIAKTEKLKKLENERMEMSSAYDKVLRYLPEEANLISSSIEKGSMNITIETKTALEVSILMSNYFSEDLAEAIILKSARLNINEKTFTTQMEVVFK